MLNDLFASLGRPAVLDLSGHPHYFWALLPEIVLSLGGMAVLILDVWTRDARRSEPSRPAVTWTALGVLVLASLANLALVGVRDASGVGLVATDGFRVFANFIFLLSGALTLLISGGWLERRDLNRGEYHALVLFAVLGMMLMAGARDLMMLFIGLEVMSLSIYVLVGFDRLDPRSSEASLKYFLLGAFSSAFFLYGVALVFGATGSTQLAAVATAIAGGARSGMLLAGIGLTMVGFAFKVAAIPFHVWTPDAYDGAPTPVTGLMATGVKAAAFAAFIRVFMLAFGDMVDAWQTAAWWLAAVTMVVANFVALTQGSVKRMLAYSSIAHAGYLLVALLSATESGAAAFLFYLLAYTVTTVGAFGIVAANARGDHERVTLEEYAGLAREKPWLAAMFSLFLLSLAGFPLTAGFLGKLYVLRSALEAGQVSLAVLLVLTSVVSYFYYLRVVVVMYMRPAPSPEAHRTVGLPGTGMVAVGAAAALVLILFFAGAAPLEWAQESAGSLWTSQLGAFAAAPAR